MNAINFLLILTAERLDHNSRAQYAVLQQLGIKKVYAVVGFSMGGQQVWIFTSPFISSIDIWAYRHTIGQ